MPEKLSTIVGRNLRTARLRHGLSQEDLAHRVGKSLTYVGQVERGTRNLTLTSVEQIAEWVGLNPLDLFAVDGRGN